ncbi:unnamed protein product [Coregonus sp. 'balchen']|nr:unnamed protein product [Coregonus sp. 'balchen']
MQRCIRAMAVPSLSAPLPLLVALLQLAILPLVHAGAYYGHKQHQQHPQQHQPMPHLSHIGMGGKEQHPQQQWPGKEMPHMQYPQYRKEIPQMPMHMGKEYPRKGGVVNGGQDKGETEWQSLVRPSPVGQQEVSLEACQESRAQLGLRDLRDPLGHQDLLGKDSQELKENQAPLVPQDSLV